ncbi:MAG: hypothetical protein ACO4AJ_12230, partial [Prochlorothrix sp.]
MHPEAHVPPSQSPGPQPPDFHPLASQPPSTPPPPSQPDNWRDRVRPIAPGSAYPAQEHCSQCGLCDTYYV